jgi:hypothetical protein
MAKTYTTKTLATIKKGDIVTLLSFTNMNLGQFEVTAVSKTQFKVISKKGAELVFNKKDGTQANAENAKYANKAVDKADLPERNTAGIKKPKKAAKAAPAPEVEDDDEMDEDGEEEEEAPAPKSKSKKGAKAAPAGKTTKKTAPPAEPEEFDGEEDEDEEDWEEA